MKYDIEWAVSKATEYGLAVPADDKTTRLILNGLCNTSGHCPCISPAFHSDDTICPCRTVREGGVCHCGLFKTCGDDKETK